MPQESVTRDDAETTRRAELPSIIAAGLRVVGTVVSAGVIHVEGEVEGDIECAELTIGAGGRVDGRVRANAVYVLGLMNGTIRAGAVRIGTSGQVTGEVIHKTIEIAPGARLDGYFRPIGMAEKPMSVDSRRQAGRAAAREEAQPPRSSPPRHKAGRRPVPSRPLPDETAKPLH